MFAPRTVILPTASDLVRIDAAKISDAAQVDGKCRFALRLWQRGDRVSDAQDFLTKMRRFYAPEPAHMAETIGADVQAWRMVDFQVHDFVMDGADWGGHCIGDVRPITARVVAEQTYFMTWQKAHPIFFTVTMPGRMYHRVLFPFFDETGQVGRIVNLIKPVLKTRTLAEILSA